MDTKTRLRLQQHYGDRVFEYTQNGYVPRNESTAVSVAHLAQIASDAEHAQTRVLNEMLNTTWHTVEDVFNHFIPDGRDYTIDPRTLDFDLQWTDLPEKIANDRLYHEALCLARSRTTLQEISLMNIYCHLRMLEDLLPGDIAELGSYRGGNALFMAKICKELYPDVVVYACDTFTGMPETGKYDPKFKQGDLANADLVGFKRLRDLHKLSNLEILEGEFSATLDDLPAFLSLAYIDCDTYDSTKFVLNNVSMVRGGFWLFDDALQGGCLGELRAIEEVLVKGNGMHAIRAYPQLVYQER